MASVMMPLPDEIPVQEARFLLALKLFELHRVSLGRAAEIAGCPKVNFMTEASRLGVPVLDYAPGELERELEL